MFAIATFKKPQLLIMDEPTNHLDVDSREALIHAVNEYDGAVLLISHDRHLVNACADRLWLVENADVRRFDGDLDDYRRHLLALRAGERAEKRGPKVVDTRKAARQTAAEERKRLAPYKRAVEKAEAAVETLEGEKATLEKRLADPSLYEGQKPGSAERIQDLQLKLANVKNKLDLAELDWIDAEDSLATAQALDG